MNDLRDKLMEMKKKQAREVRTGLTTSFRSLREAYGSGNSIASLVVLLLGEKAVKIEKGERNSRGSSERDDRHGRKEGAQRKEGEQAMATV